METTNENNHFIEGGPGSVTDSYEFVAGALLWKHKLILASLIKEITWSPLFRFVPCIAPFPEKASICPRRDTTFLTGVVIVRKQIIFVSRRENYVSLYESLKTLHFMLTFLQKYIELWDKVWYNSSHIIIIISSKSRKFFPSLCCQAWFLINMNLTITKKEVNWKNF